MQVAGDAEPLLLRRIGCEPIHEPDVLEDRNHLVEQVMHELEISPSEMATAAAADVEPPRGRRVVAKRDRQQRGGIERVGESDRQLANVLRCDQTFGFEDIDRQLRGADPEPRVNVERDLRQIGKEEVHHLGWEGSRLGVGPIPGRRSHPRLPFLLLDHEPTRVGIVEVADRLEDPMNGAIDPESGVREQGHIAQQREPRARTDLVLSPRRRHVA